MITRMSAWFRRKPKEVVPSGLSPAEREYRLERIQTFQNISDRPREEIIKIMDSWNIEKGVQQVGDDPEEVIYIPRPLWDDEFLYTRHGYPSYDLARAEVTARGGIMFEDLNLNEEDSDVDSSL